ncbi:hypothetical protein KUTeg_024596 [Tegillarca granosa]|uniref:Cyclin A n=1 Tax=Tegillarca granosa TaxID=220873 RepID=A0ABQ9E3G1_TEGGR|nr:hypothetical protein KUTeg_024596 [Tegillarca granosa]
MSFVFGSTFQPHEDLENHGARRVKRENMTARNNAQQGTKRAALGTITNQVRVQPFRAAKQSGVADCNDENAFVKQKTFDATQGFSIYVDSEPKQTEALKPAFKKVESNKLSLSSAVTALPRQLEAISTASPDVVCLDSSFESPMVLDISHEVEEKKPLDREAIITHLKNRPKPGYMKKQPDITNSMRSILVDWLVEVSEEYKLHRETLFLSVNYIDRFLSQMSVQRGKLQLVGAASMFIAAFIQMKQLVSKLFSINVYSKYEEIYPPDVGEFAYITDDTYTKKQVLRMEHLILKVLSFDVAVPTSNWFCEHLLNESNVDEKTKSLAMFLVELTLVELDPYLKYPPSMIAAAALCLARFSLGMEPWPETIAKTAKYELGHFAECLRDLHKTYCGAAKHPQQAVVEKYKASKHHEVSNFERYSPPDSLPLIG